MSTTGYTADAFKMGMLNMPSNFKQDYTQAANGLWYFNGGGNKKTPSGSADPNTPSPAKLAGIAAGAEANRLVQAGESAVGSAVNAAAGNLDTVKGMVNLSNAQVGADLNAARSAGAGLTDTAAQVGGYADKVDKSASEVGAQADIFQQYAEGMQRDAVFAQANALPWIQTGNDILSMNPNAGGMAGEWSKLYKQMSPDSMAAGAATSTRKAATVAEQSMLQSLSRRGVSAGSGAVAAALGKLNDRVESNVAAMMTAAHKAGLTMQSDALKNGFVMALQASGMGEQFADEALAAEMAATDAQAKATSALTTQGSLQAQAAGIVATKGNLLNAAGNLALGIAANVSNNTSSNISGLNAATNTQVNAESMAADYYSTQGGSLLSMLTQQKYNVLTALFGQVGGVPARA